MTEQKLQLYLFGGIAGATAFSILASTVHLVTIFYWLNYFPIALAMGVSTVLVNAAFVALKFVGRGRLMPPHAEVILTLAMVMLILVEVFGNFLVGGLMLMDRVPQRALEFLDIDRPTAYYTGAWFFAGMWPLINTALVYALALTGVQALREREAQQALTNVERIVTDAQGADNSRWERRN